MKSKTSYFNGTILLKSIKRFWPVWAAYLVIWLAILPGALGSMLSETKITREIGYITHEFVLDMSTDVAAVFVFCAAIGSAMCVFSFMYNSRSVGGMEVLPIKREGMFLMQVLAGILPLMIANILVFLVSLCVEATAGAVAVTPLLQWLAMVSIELVTFFGIACLCAQLTGHIIILPLVYLILNLVAVVVNLALSTLLRIFVYGMSSASNPMGALATLFSPIFYILSSVRTFTPSEYNAELDRYETFYDQCSLSECWPVMLSYLAVGIIFIVIAMLLFKKRRMEACGDIVAINVLKPVFKYCFTFGGALVLGILLYDQLSYNMMRTYGGVWLILLCMLLGGVVCYFAAEMLIKKSFHVFSAKAFIGLAASVVIITALTLAGEYDLFGYERHIPDIENIEAVTIYCEGSPVTFKEPENIEKVTALHERLAADKRENEAFLKSNGTYNDGVSLTYIDLRYWLPNDKSLWREYEIISPIEDIKLMEELLNTREAILSRKETSIEITPESISYAHIEFLDPNGETADPYGGDKVYPYTTIELTREEAYELYSECLLPDFNDCTLGRIWLITDDSYYNTIYDATIRIEVRGDVNKDQVTYDYMYTVPTADSLRTKQWLEEHDIPLTLITTPEDKYGDYPVPMAESTKSVG